jgi:hypothetical protein
MDDDAFRTRPPAPVRSMARDAGHLWFQASQARVNPENGLLRISAPAEEHRRGSNNDAAAADTLFCRDRWRARNVAGRGSNVENAALWVAMN